MAVFDPGPVPSVKEQSSAQIPAKTAFIVKDGDKYKLAGVGADHLLRALLKATGINPDGFSDRIAGILDGARSGSFSNLGDPAAWVGLARKLRGVAVSEGLGGAPKT